MKLVEIRQLAEEARDENGAYYRFLQKLVEFYDMDIVVECGTGEGGSGIKMAEGNDHVLVITIDNNLHPNTRKHLNTNYPNIITIEGDTEEVSAQVETALAGKTIDLLFIDSTHDGHTPRKEFEIYSKYFSPIALVVADDISIDKIMENFWTNMPGEKASFLYLHPRYHTGFGVSIIRNDT
jgi:predicted O-methyltransferase YrrM